MFILPQALTALLNALESSDSKEVRSMMVNQLRGYLMAQNDEVMKAWQLWDHGILRVGEYTIWLCGDRNKYQYAVAKCSCMRIPADKIFDSALEAVAFALQGWDVLIGLATEIFLGDEDGPILTKLRDGSWLLRLFLEGRWMTREFGTLEEALSDGYKVTRIPCSCRTKEPTMDITTTAFDDLIAKLKAEYAPSREISLTITKLEEARMWFSKAIEPQPAEGN